MRHLDRARELAGEHTLVYVPCHRSHIDYLLLSYVLFMGASCCPIAAGNNLNLPVAGPCYGEAVRFSCAANLPGRPHTAVFESYVDHPLTHGFAKEYFVEGGRSRSGRMLSARWGMLRMTLGAHNRGSAVPWPLCPCISATSASLRGGAI